MTPLDPHFSLENAFTIPGAYFSPLTSPALHAQSDSALHFDHGTNSNNSPVEMDIELSSTAPIASALDLPRKARKNNAAKARSKPAIKSSPISKPQRRKTGPSPAIVSQVLTEVDEQSTPIIEPSLLPMPASSVDSPEENASVSPETLSDMPPPPVPNRRSASKSPYIQAQQSSAKSGAQQTHPATPASLMKLPASKSKGLASNYHESPIVDHIDYLKLPESASGSSLLPKGGRIVSQTSVSQSQPSLGKLSMPHSVSSPNLRAPGTPSASQSPQILPTSSTLMAKKTNPSSSRNHKRRSGSVQVSPALLPKISPIIKPLLPGTPGMSAADDATSRLLTSKSNYQNILEGNSVPGVSYPSELSTNLTSKRTSHKIAEQGRRNRINTALQEMAALLPDHHKPVSGDDSDLKDGKQAHTPSSKASVVENAISHMQHLQDENTDLKKKLQELKQQLDELQGT